MTASIRRCVLLMTGLVPLTKCFQLPGPSGRGVISSTSSASLILARPNEPGDWFDDNGQTLGGGSTRRRPTEERKVKPPPQPREPQQPKYQRYNKELDGSMLEGSDGVTFYPKKTDAQRRERNAERMRAQYLQKQQQQEEERLLRKPNLPAMSNQAKRNAERLLSLYRDDGALPSSPVRPSSASYHHESSFEDWQQQQQQHQPMPPPPPSFRGAAADRARRYDMYEDVEERNMPTIPRVSNQAKRNAEKLRSLYQSDLVMYSDDQPPPPPPPRPSTTARASLPPTGGRSSTTTTNTNQIMPLDGYYTVDRSNEPPPEAWQTDMERYNDDEDDYYDYDDDDDDDFVDEDYYYQYEERSEQRPVMQNPDSFEARWEARQQPEDPAAPKANLGFREPEPPISFREPAPPLVMRPREQPPPPTKTFRQPAYRQPDNAWEEEEEMEDRRMMEQRARMPRTLPVEPNVPFQVERLERPPTTPIRPELMRRDPGYGASMVRPLEPLGGPLGGPPAHMWGNGRGNNWSSRQFAPRRSPGPWLDGLVLDQVVQGAGSRLTVSTTHQDQTIVELGSPGGRPIYAQAQVFQGPGNTPASMNLFSEDGGLRPWRAAFQNTDRGTPSTTLDIRNTGPMEFPLEASVIGKMDGTKGMSKEEKEFVKEVEYDYVPSPHKVTQTVQGQSLKYFNIDAGVDAVFVELSSEGRPMFVQVELWKGPDAVKQCAEIYSDNGSDRHWSAIIDTHKQPCVVAVRNVGPALVYPVKASVDPIIANAAAGAGAPAY